MSRDESLYGLLFVRDGALHNFIQRCINQGGIDPREMPEARERAEALRQIICPYPNGKLREAWWLTEAGEKCSFFFLWVWGHESMSLWEFTDYLGVWAKDAGLKLPTTTRRYLTGKAIRSGAVFAWPLPESFGVAKGVYGVRRRTFLRIPEVEAYVQRVISAVKEKQK